MAEVPHAKHERMAALRDQGALTKREFDSWRLRNFSTLPGFPGPEASDALAARAYRAPGFGMFAIAMTGMALVGPGVYIAYGLISPKPNGSQGAHIGWGIALAVIGLSLICVLSLSGTTISDKGLKRRRTVNGDWNVDHLAWDQIARFGPDSGTCESEWSH